MSFARVRSCVVCGSILAMLVIAMFVMAADAPPAGGSGGGGAGGPVIKTPQGEQAIFPADNPWNQDISKLPVHPNSARYIAAMNPNKGLHADFGTVWNGAPNGIPYVVVAADQAKSAVKFMYANESDKGPYPIPADPPIEGGAKSTGDRHVLILSPSEHKLYEMWKFQKTAAGYEAGSGAIFDLTSNKLRPAGWTSADAAGLPIFPGLVRLDEAAAGEIRHALRFTVVHTQRAYILPATHCASHSTDPNLPPMGLRLRLRADFDVSKFSKEMQAILKAMKTYGLILADNGSDWFVSGCPDAKWDEEALHTLSRVKGKDFEVVDTGPVVKG